jgi:hypothetical protein
MHIDATGLIATDSEKEKGPAWWEGRRAQCAMHRPTHC